MQFGRGGRGQNHPLYFAICHIFLSQIWRCNSMNRHLAVVRERKQRGLIPWKEGGNHGRSWTLTPSTQLIKLDCWFLNVRRHRHTHTLPDVSERFPTIIANRKENKGLQVVSGPRVGVLSRFLLPICEELTFTFSRGSKSHPLPSGISLS